MLGSNPSDRFSSRNGGGQGRNPPVLSAGNRPHVATRQTASRPSTGASPDS